MKPSFFVPACGLLLAACAPAGGPGDPAEVDARASRLEQAGEWEDSARLCRSQVLPGDPASSEPWIKRSILAYLMADRLADAEGFAEEILRHSPRYAEALFFLGDGQRVAQRYEEARRTLIRLLQMAPDHNGGRLALALVQARLGNAPEALPLFEKHLQSAAEGPVRRDAQVEYARALRQAGLPGRAGDQLAAVLEEDPFHLPALAEAAQALQAQGRGEIARELRLQHGYFSRRGHALGAGDPSRLYNTGPRSAGARARQALQLADRRQFLGAIEGLRAALREDPRDASIPPLLAGLWLRLRRPVEGRAILAGIPAGHAELPRLLVALAEAVEGRPQEAREALRQAIALAPAAAAGPPDADGPPPGDLVRRACRLARRLGGGPDGLEAWVLKALEMAPGDAEIRICAAELAAGRGQPRAALELLEALPAAVREQSPACRRARAVALGLGGDLQPAAREIMVLIRDAPDAIENFLAFEDVFASKRGEAEVDRVLEMKQRLEARRRRSLDAIESLGAAPLERCAPIYLAIVKEGGATLDRETALDFLSMAAELDRQDIQAWRSLAGMLQAPREIFLRLRAHREILRRSPGDDPAAIGLIQGYLELAWRLDEAERLALGLDRPGEAPPGGDRWLEAVRSLRRSAGGAR